MHLVNRFLHPFGIRVSRASPVRSTVPAELRGQLALCRRNDRAFEVLVEIRQDAGRHPQGQVDFECAFAAACLAAERPSRILDVGSYRTFTLGLMGMRTDVTTVDVRPRTAELPNEHVITCDAKRMNLPDSTIDAVVSLCAIEHFGLGRYGDDFDLDADVKAFREMVRVARAGAIVVITSTITRGRAAIAFNSHRIYDRQAMMKFGHGLKLIHERFYSHSLGRACAYEEVTDKPGIWDVCAYCWEKPPHISPRIVKDRIP